MKIEDYLSKECNVNPDEKISTNDDSWWKLKDLIANYIEEEGLVKNNCDLPVVSGSVSKNELILQLLEKIEKEKGGEIKEYENTMLCGKGKITITINVDYHYR